MRAIDGDRLKRKAQKVATEAWKMKIKANVEVILNEFIDWINDAPTIEPERKKGEWIYLDKDKRFFHPHIVKCSVCNNTLDMYGVNAGRGDANFCPNCGADMRIPVETARDIVHEAIDNSVWSDTVDTTKMHKVVDNKYAEMTEDE